MIYESGDSAVAQSKQALRQQVREARKFISRGDIAEQGQKLLLQMRHVVERFNANTLTCFWPTKNEPNTVPFIEWAEANEITVFLPISRPQGVLEWAPFQTGAMTTGAFGIAEPTTKAIPEIFVADSDVIFVPAAAADFEGIRLGWGLGYYDRFLAKVAEHKPVLAVLHDSEIFIQLPAEAHDQRISGAVTPLRTLLF